MEVRTFRASSLQEALLLVRQSLGPDASVLQTREIRKGRLGIFSRAIVEVEASTDVPVASRFDVATEEDPHQPTTASFPTNTYDSQEPESQSPDHDSPGDSRVLNASSTDRQAANKLSRRVKNGTSAYPESNGVPPGSRASIPSVPVQNRVETTVTQSDHPAMRSPDAALNDVSLDLLSDLLEIGVDPRTAKELLMEASDRCGNRDRNDPWLLKVSLHQSIAQRLKVSGSVEVDPQGQKIIAFVGSTGVGKTTTLAKIAAGFRFDLGCQVGLITLDTFRLGAVDQLLQYAELISAQLEVVSSPDEVTAALARLRECDLILLDTAGRSPRDSGQLRMLTHFLQAAQPDSTHLVVSASSSKRHVEDTLNKFSVLNPTNLLITKLDEAVDFGAWLPMLFSTELPVSYLTTGQHVPQDIVVASPRRLARELVGNELRYQEIHLEQASNAPA